MSCYTKENIPVGFLLHLAAPEWLTVFLQDGKNTACSNIRRALCKIFMYAPRLATRDMKWV